MPGHENVGPPGSRITLSGPLPTQPPVQGSGVPQGGGQPATAPRLGSPGPGTAPTLGPPLRDGELRLPSGDEISKVIALATLGARGEGDQGDTPDFGMYVATIRSLISVFTGVRFGALVDSIFGKEVSAFVAQGQALLLGLEQADTFLTAFPELEAVTVDAALQRVRQLRECVPLLAPLLRRNGLSVEAVLMDIESGSAFLEEKVRAVVATSLQKK